MGKKNGKTQKNFSLCRSTIHSPLRRRSSSAARGGASPGGPEGRWDSGDGTRIGAEGSAVRPLRACGMPSSGGVASGAGPRAMPSGVREADGKATGGSPGRGHGPSAESRGANGRQNKDGAGSGRESVLKERLGDLQLPAGDDESDAGMRVYCEDGSGQRTYATLQVRPCARPAPAPAACLAMPALRSAQGSAQTGRDSCQRHGPRAACRRASEGLRGRRSETGPHEHGCGLKLCACLLASLWCLVRVARALSPWAV